MTMQPEQFFWRGWERDSFFDDDIQAVLKQRHGANPATERRAGYAIAAWSKLDRFRLDYASGAARAMDAGIGHFAYRQADWELCNFMKIDALWFFELGRAIFLWKNRNAEIWNRLGGLPGRRNAHIEEALSYWRMRRALDDHEQWRQTGKIASPEKWGVVVAEMEQMGFVDGDGKNCLFTDASLRQCVRREDNRRKHILDFWAEGWADYHNHQGQTEIVTAEGYKEVFGRPRGRDKK
jgi:hypothetical protein